jgi:uncharacterized protein (TIGR00251 family)
MLQLDIHSRGVVLGVKVQARARRSGVGGEREGMLRVAVTAAPEKGKANQAVIEVLSRALRVPKSAIELIAGETSTRKRVLVVGATAEQLRAALPPSCFTAILIFLSVAGVPLLACPAVL